MDQASDNAPSMLQVTGFFFPSLMETRGLIRQWLISSQMEVKPSLLAHILLDITRDPTTLQTVVATLSERGSDVRKCVDLLAQVTVHSRSTIDYAAADLLVEFACQRMPQADVAGRCIDMIKSLVDGGISSTTALMVCESMINNLSKQKLHQDSRHKVLITIERLLQSHVGALRTASFDFVGGFITIVDGEKDPRNLLIAFELVRDVIAKFDISSHIEDLFDFTFCYFPITFKPPPNDPYHITTEDLKSALRQCLASTPYFASFATPLLIEKLLTATGSAKRDTMETIGLCAPAYGAHALLPHVQNIFDMLSKEVYNASSVAMESTALETIHSVVATLASGIFVADIRELVEKAIRSLLDPCITQLQHPESKKAKSAGYILRAAASAADPACSCVVHTVVPMLTGLLRADDTPVRRKAIVDIFNEILKGSNSLYGSLDKSSRDSMEDDIVSPLAAYKQEIFTALMSALLTEDEHLRLSGLKGMRLLVVMKQFLLPSEMQSVLHHLTRIYLSYREDQTSRLALTTLGTICKLDPSSIEHHVVPALLGCLSSEMPVEGFSQLLEALDTFAFQPQVSRAVIPSLLEKMGGYLSHRDQSIDFHYAHSLTRSILHAIRTTSKDLQIAGLAQRVVFPRLLLESIKVALGLPDAWQLDKEIIDLWAMVLAVILRSSTISYQQAVISDAFKIFLYGDLSTVPLKVNQCRPLLLTPCSTPQKDISVLFPAIAGNCKREVEAPVSSCPELLGSIIASVTDQDFMFTQKLAIARIVGSIANKCKNAHMPDTIKSLVANRLMPMINDAASPEAVRRTSVFLVSWLAKALLIKSHSLGFELLDSLVNQLHSSEDLGPEAAESFIVILHDDDLVLTKAAFANISILYKQRVFNHCAPKLLQGAEHPTEVIRINHLIAFSHIITNIPNQIIHNEIKKLVPVINASITAIANPHLLLSLVRVVQNVVPDAANTISFDDMRQLTQALLRLTSGYRMDVRIASLRCLRTFALRCKEELRPLVMSVTKDLAVALDDKKRQVRKEAVDCREKWYNLIDIPRV